MIFRMYATAEKKPYVEAQKWVDEAEARAQQAELTMSERAELAEKKAYLEAQQWVRTAEERAAMAETHYGLLARVSFQPVDFHRQAFLQRGRLRPLLHEGGSLLFAEAR